MNLCKARWDRYPCRNIRKNTGNTTRHSSRHYATLRHLSSYRCGVICLTPSSPHPLGDLAHQRGQIEQIVRSPPRPSGRDLRKGVLATEACPRQQHRAQSAARVEIHRSFLAPALTLVPQYPAGTTQGMERMRDLEGDLIMVRTSCSC